MLHFASPSNSALTALVNDALEMMHEDFDERFVDENEMQRIWKTQYPSAATVFPVPLVRPVNEQLLTASQRPEVYEITDYHWLFLFDCLRHYCGIHNDLVREEHGPISVGPYQIGQIDFDDLLDQYFWDLDFLLDAEDVVAIGMQGRRMLGMNQETFGLVLGMQPHPAELKIVQAEGSEVGETDPLLPEGSVIPAFPYDPDDPGATIPPPATLGQ